MSLCYGWNYFFFSLSLLYLCFLTSTKNENKILLIVSEPRILTRAGTRSILSVYPPKKLPPKWGIAPPPLTWGHTGTLSFLLLPSRSATP